MRIKKTKVYLYQELSDESKEKAHADYLASGCDYFWENENQAVLTAFCDVFPITANDWAYGDRNFINSEIDTASADEEKAYYDFTGVRLLKYIVNNYWQYLYKRKYIGHLRKKEKFSSVYSHCQWENSCVLTGYCIDDAILQPLYDFITRPDKTSSFEDILKDCLECWVVACNKDYEYSCSEEFFADLAERNEFEFTADGKIA